MTELQWEIYRAIMARDYYRFMAEQAQKEIDALRIVELCLTGE